MSVHRLRNFLLPKTIAHAVHNASFYQRHWADVDWANVQSTKDLPLLPPVEKAHATREQADMRVGAVPLDFGAVSSGTTRVGNGFFRVEHNEAERIALDDFYARGAAQEAAVEPENAEGESGEQDATLNGPLVLHIITPNHGLPGGAAPDNTLRLAWSYSKNVNQMIVEALARNYGGRRISVMRVSMSILKQLTAYFLRTGVDFSRFAVERIGTNAALVTRRWRQVIESKWNARIYDNYSISEVLTPATECTHCGYAHFGDPPMVPEVLNVASGVPLSEGVGELLLTTLYPFVQRQPLIRYRTGDIVELGPRCDVIDDVGIRFLGRRHQTVLNAAGTEVLLAAARVENVADDFPWIARHTHPFERTQDVPAGTVGQPRYRLRHEGTDVVVEAGVGFDPRLFPQQTDMLSEALRSAVLAAHPALLQQTQSDARQLKVTLVQARDDDWTEWFVKYLI